jgi:hypothetical protein
MRIVACIPVNGSGISSHIYECDAGSCITVGYAAVSTQGCSTSIGSVASPFTIDNNAKTYLVDVQMIDTVSSFSAVKIDYKLQVSPAPTLPTFADVPNTHPFYQYIEALAASGITAGCSTAPPQYCPDAPLTRGQMAVFLAKALGLHWPN